MSTEDRQVLSVMLRDIVTVLDEVSRELRSLGGNPAQVEKATRALRMREFHLLANEYGGTAGRLVETAR